MAGEGDAEIRDQAKRIFEMLFEARMGMTCSTRFYKDVSMGFIVSAKEKKRMKAVLSVGVATATSPT